MEPPPTGRLIVSWDPFTSSDDITIDGGSASFAFVNGTIAISLAPNIGATPGGTSYKVRYYLENGASYEEHWIVPSGGPFEINDVRVTSPPITNFTLNAATQLSGSVPLANGGTNRPDAWTTSRCVRVNDAGSALEPATGDCGTGGGGGHTIQDEGISLTSRTFLNLTGTGITCTDDAGNDQTDCDVPAGGGLADPGGNGIVVRTALNTTVNRTLTGDAEIVVANGDGVAGNPTLSIAAALARDSEINVQGGTGLASTGSGVAPTLSLDYTDAGADPALATDECRFTNDTTTANVNDLDELAVEAELEAVLDLPDLQGTLADAQVDGSLESDEVDHDATTNFVADEHVAHSGVTLTAGAGLSGGGTIATNRTFDTASGEANFLADGGVTSLTCGASQLGKAQVMDDGTLEWCDGATTSVLRTSALGDGAGAALSGDSATAFFPAGTVEAARLPNLDGMNAQIADAQIAAGAVDGGNLSEIADGSITTDDLGTDSVSADELNATGVEVELEAVLDLPDMQGTLADAQVDGSLESDEVDHDATTNFVADEHVAHSGVTLTAGAGLSGGGTIAANRTFDTASGEANFLADGGVTSLTCGASQLGKAQVMDDGTLEWCDGATTSVLRTSALGDGAGAALSGDTATAFFASGTLEDARLSANVSLLGTDIDLASAEVTGTLPVGNGGTGAATLTDGGLLLGSGTGAITALGVATNGQIPIGDGTTDPVLANITAEAGGEISVTNGAGSIELDVVEANLLLSAIGGTIGDAQIAAGAVDGGSAGEIADGSVDSNDLATANKTLTCNFTLFDSGGLSDTDDIASISNCSRPGRAITITQVICETDRARRR